MLFRIDRNREVKSTESNTQILTNFISVVLMGWVTRVVGSEQSIYQVYGKFMTKNLPTNLRSFIHDNNKDDADKLVKENILTQLVDGFLLGKNLDGTDSGTKKFVTDTLNQYTPSKSNTLNANDFSLFESKVGIIYQGFENYFNNNYKGFIKTEIYEMERDREDDDSDDVSFKIEDRAAPEQDFLENIPSINRALICQHIYSIFYKNTRSELENTKKLCDLYNIILSLDVNVRKRARDTHTKLNTVIHANSLTEQEWDSLELLVDQTVYNNINSLNDMRKLEEVSKILPNWNPEELEIILSFFVLLIKSQISLNSKVPKYFKNLEVFRISTIKDLESFKEIMETTTHSLSNYPTFPLLKDTNLESLTLSKSKIRNEDLPSPKEFARELREGSKITEKSERTPTRDLTDYLNEIMYFGAHGNQLVSTGNLKYDFNLPWVPGKIEKKDLILCKQILNVTHTKNIRDYMDIYQVLNSNKYRLSIDQSDWMINSKFKEILSNTKNLKEGTYEETIAYRRLKNILEVIQISSKELIYLEQLEHVEGDTLLESNDIIDYIKVDQYEIPKAEIIDNMDVKIMLYGIVPLYINGPEFKSGYFTFKKVNRGVTITQRDEEGVKVSPIKEVLDIYRNNVEESRYNSKTDGTNPNEHVIDLDLFLSVDVNRLQEVNKNKGNKNNRVYNSLEEESVLVELDSFLEF